MSQKIYQLFLSLIDSEFEEVKNNILILAIIRNIIKLIK